MNMSIACEELFDVIENNTYGDDETFEEFEKHSQVLTCCICGDYSEHEFSFLCEPVCEVCKKAILYGTPPYALALIVVLVKKVKELQDDQN